MKTAIKFIVAVSFLFSFSFCKAQKVQKWVVTERQNEIKGYNYIFEGTVTQQTKNGNWMCSVVQITKIYKGSPQIKLGTIRVVMELQADGEPAMTKGSKYVLFGRPASSSLDTIQTAENTLTLQCIDHIDFHGTGATWGARQPQEYKTVDSLYSYFKENGLAVQQEAQQK
jgi:hypothetical protein